jgi:hypothetical protein
VIELSGVRWLENLAHTGENINVYRVLVGKSEGKNHLEDLGVDGRIILK